jgi:hypothetical protein
MVLQRDQIPITRILVSTRVLSNSGLPLMILSKSGPCENPGEVSQDGSIDSAISGSYFPSPEVDLLSTDKDV